MANIPNHIAMTLKDATEAVDVALGKPQGERSAQFAPMQLRIMINEIKELYAKAETAAKPLVVCPKCRGKGVIPHE